MALGALGVSGEAAGVGGGAAVHWFPVNALSLRAGGGARAGGAGAANATTLAVSLTAGVAWHPHRPSPSSPIGVSVRCDYLLAYQSVSPDSDPQLARGRWMSGIAGATELDWLLTGNLDALLGVGVEDVFAPTYLDVQGTRVATLPPLRAFAELGGRIRF
jgi:hypothetical protein